MISSFLTFTFHYVSINIYACFFTCTFAAVFTFHYVSINIYVDRFAFERFLDLHSTMYLLIFKAALQLAFAGRFTFHYVSINITSSVYINFHKVNLHSTMYLLISCCATNSFGFAFIYIPLCIY